ncbi:MAG: riboflavin synthase [Polyangiaceae bacterium]
MFTGLVETIGTLRRRSGSPVARAQIEARFSGPLVLGESIAVNGVCLTVDRILEGGFEADMSAETLARTTLGDLTLGARVHLERATPANGRLGGHIVAGHVDGVGKVEGRSSVGDAIRLATRVPPDLSPFVANKGSITIDGVSLTINDVRDDASGSLVEVMLVPHTLGATLLGDKSPGDRANIEVDVLARYVARWLEFGGKRPISTASAPTPEDDERLLQKLRSSGYL